MLAVLRAALDFAARDAAVGAVVLTGSDPYYCAGVSLTTLRPMAPRALREFVAPTSVGTDFMVQA